MCNLSVAKTSWLTGCLRLINVAYREIYKLQVDELCHLLNNKNNSEIYTKYWTGTLGIIQRLISSPEGGKMFSVTVAQLWNSLSLNLRRQASASLFRRKFEKLL